VEVVEDSGLVYEFGRFVVDPKERTLFADGIPVHLRAKEFDTLIVLLEHNGHALSKEEMMSAVWQGAFVEESNLAKQISRLRKLLNTDGEEFIETLPKHGYRFRASVRRCLVESEDAVILEKRTVKRVTFAIEGGTEGEVPALPPPRRPFLRASRVTLLLVMSIVGLAVLGWYFRETIFDTRPAIDPYAPVRLTDNPNDDTVPSWTQDGRIRFRRVYPDNRSETLIMNADGTGQTEIGIAGSRTITGWSHDEQKIIFVKNGDASKLYLSNADGSSEIPLPVRPGGWSMDSKMMTFRQKVADDPGEVFVYFLETGEIRNISNNPTFDADPSFSPDGKQVVYDSARDGNQEVYVTNIDGTGTRRLTFSPALDVHPSFSPDGTQILFNSDRENENGDVYVINADGSGRPVKLTTWDKSNETAEPGSWSPDGTKILFYSDCNGKDDIYVMSAETVRPKLLLADPKHDLSAPSYSPDGKEIVYSKKLEDKSAELRTFDLETGSSAFIKKTELPSITTDWSPDGRWILFSDRVNGNSEVFVVRPDGSELQNLTNNELPDIDPAWSRDGTHIVFISGRSQGIGVQLYVMNADGSEPHPVTSQKGWESDPKWADDNSRIIFSCDRTDVPGNMLDICEIGADGSGERRVVSHRSHDMRPAVSPDGNRIVFLARSDGNLELYVVNRDGSGLLRLTRDLADEQPPAWSPDGKKIVFSSNRGGLYAIYELEMP